MRIKVDDIHAIECVIAKYEYVFIFLFSSLSPLSFRSHSDLSCSHWCFRCVFSSRLWFSRVNFNFDSLCSNLWTIRSEY